jgi:hypothetical protein
MTTSKKEASQAGKDLRDPKTPKKDRGPIASDLSQAPRKKEVKQLSGSMPLNSFLRNISLGTHVSRYW